MSQEARLSYLANPQKFCELVNNLINRNDETWAKVWKAAILELFQSPDYSVNSINSLLKVIERAFKERTYTIRAQAFECWQFFITKVELHTASEKLLNVILIPLCASNHSVFIVLRAKLTTWFTLLNTSLIAQPIVKEKGIPSLLKILYGPHSLPIASSYDDLLELCGTLYGILVVKCLPHEENDVILSYLEKAIPALSLNRNTQAIAKKIWSDALDHISLNKWPSIQFNHLMKTFENLLSSNNEQNNAFVCELLSCLICEYNSIPVDYLMFHLNLVTRCLFHSSVNDVSLMSTMESLLKKCKKKESFFFDEVNKTLTEFSEDYKNKLQKCWIAVVTCFSKWIKTISDLENCEWILLFPVKNLHDKWNSEIVEQMQQCYENIALSGGNDVFVRNLFRRLDVILNKSENVPVSLLNAATCLCKIVLQKSKPSQELSSARPILLTIYKKMPPQVPMDGVHKSFAAKYLTCVLYFLECYPDYSNDFTGIIRSYRQFIDVDKEAKELMSKYKNKLSEDSENNPSVLKFCNGVNMLNSDKITPSKPKIRSSFLARLSPADKKSTNVENSSPARSVLTPKSSQKSKIQDDNEVQFIPIPPKPKNSPMTEHQKEMAKEKSYIPALYEDLSQSQSQSDSISLLSPKKKQPVSSVCSEYMEENANLPSSNSNTDSADEVPASFNFRDAIRPEKSTNTFASKKSLFNESSSDLENTFGKAISHTNIEDIPILENDSTASASESSANERPRSKRKSLRIDCKTPDAEPPKRSRPSIARNTDAEKGANNKATPSSAGQTEERRSVRLRRSITKRSKETPVTSETDVINLTDSESQNLFVTRTPTRSFCQTPVASSPMLMNVKNSADGKKSRRRSLRSKNTDSLVRKSPIALRKRKSLATEVVEPENGAASDNSNDNARDEAAANASENQKDLSEQNILRSEVEKEIVKTRAVAPCQQNSNELSAGESSSGTSSLSSSSAVTVILNAEDTVPIGFNDTPVKSVSPVESAETGVAEAASQMADSVVIIEDERAMEIISIADSQTQTQVIEDSQNQSQPIVGSQESQPNDATCLADTKVSVKSNESPEESTFFESTEVANDGISNTTELVEATPKENSDQTRLPVDICAMSQTRSEHSFSLALSPGESIVDHRNDIQVDKSASADRVEDMNVPVEGGSVTEVVSGDSVVKIPACISVSPVQAQVDSDAKTASCTSVPASAVNEQPEKPSASSNEGNATASKTAQESENQEKSENQAAEKSGSENLQSNVADESVMNSSPLSGNTRTSQMLKMVFGAQSLTKPKGRGKMQSNRNSGGCLTPGSGGAMTARTTTNSRTMKMLQVNGHRESPVRPSPSKKTNVVTEKIERLNYTPKECTSPGILKRPNLNSTLSPKSPKSVNFAENLTDTREYQVDEDNYSDTWISSDTQLSNNLLSDEEGTSQETLYSPLQNCSDDIKNIVERLSLNQQQLDTLRRMGIETVGQLASASTIVGKSIPVGDNRLTRLRNALKAYDNDRKLKGLRAPSVRRKIVYKSLNKQVEVGSIIEILDDSDSSEPEAEEAPTKAEQAEKLRQMCQPTVKITKVEDDEMCSYVLNKSLSPSKAGKCGVLGTDDKSEIEIPKSGKPAEESSVAAPQNNVEADSTAKDHPSPAKKEPTPARIQLSPVRVQLSPVSLPYSPPKRQSSPSQRQSSPAKGLPSPTKRQLFPEDEPPPVTTPPTKVQSSPAKRQLSPDEEPASPIKRQRSPVKESRDEVASQAVVTGVAETRPSSDPVAETQMEVEPSEVTAEVSAVATVDVAVVSEDTNAAVPAIETDDVTMSETQSQADVSHDVEGATPRSDNVRCATESITVESTVENVTDDGDFICTGNDESVCKSEYLRTYSRLVKTRTSIAPLDVEASAAGETGVPVSSPEIISVDMVELRAPEKSIQAEEDEEESPQEKSMQSEEEEGEFSEKKDEQHSQSIFSPTLDSASQSLIDGSRYLLPSTCAHCGGGAGDEGSRKVVKFQRLLQSLLKPNLGEVVAARFASSSDDAEERVVEMMVDFCSGLDKSPADVRLKNALSEWLSSI